NIWIAAGDGDLARVQELVLAGTLPNIPDEFTYTPMHAAASYGHIDILEFLLAHGGDINITDDDGETPLYVVEDVVTTRWLIDHGAVIDRTNKEGVSPIESLAEDYPQVAEFLQAETAIRKLD
ncbi:ankyrin repeat-containing domain protein, partial [Armillaria luteobubalina]